MIKETHKKRIDSPSELMIYVILAAILIIALSTVAGRVRMMWHIQHPEYFIYVCMLLVAARIIRRLVVEYHYTLIDDELVFERFFYRRMEERVNIRLSSISQYCPVKDCIDKNNLMPKKFCHHHKNDRGIYALYYYKQNNEPGLLYIHPTKEFKLGLDKAYADVTARKMPGAFVGDYIGS